MAEITEDRVKLIVRDCLQEYELTVGGVRHRENLAEFRGMRTILDKQEGSFVAIKVIGTVIAFAVMATLALLSYIATHHDGHSALSAHDPILAQRFTNDAGAK